MHEDRKSSIEMSMIGEIPKYTYLLLPTITITLQLASQLHPNMGIIDQWTRKFFYTSCTKEKNKHKVFPFAIYLMYSAYHAPEARQTVEIFVTLAFQLKQ